MKEPVYVLTVECANRDIAEDIQTFVNMHFHSGQIFWNAIHVKQ